MLFESPVFTVFYKKKIKIIIIIIIIKNEKNKKNNQGCEVKLKQTNFATKLQFQWLQEQRCKIWFDKVVNTMEHVK